ncbi:MAG: prepilin peptidase [Candidatus Peregrinibacteria bacterium]
MVTIEYSWIVLFAVLGLAFGSFGTVLISRVPKGQHIGGRSHCSTCKRTLGVGDLIPLLSYIFLCGRCRRCHRAIGMMYPCIEGASSLLFVLALFLEHSILPSLLLALSLWLLLLIAVIDLRTRTIHDTLNFSFIFFAVAHAVSLGQFQVTGALLLGGFFAAQWLLSKGRWMGSGDIILGIGIGFLLGSATYALLCLGLAYVLGAVVAVFLLTTHRATRKSAVPFGPFLACAALSVLLFGNQILSMLIYR